MARGGVLHTGSSGTIVTEGQARLRTGRFDWYGPGREGERFGCGAAAGGDGEEEEEQEQEDGGGGGGGGRGKKGDRQGPYELLKGEMNGVAQVPRRVQRGVRRVRGQDVGAGTRRSCGRWVWRSGTGWRRWFVGNTKGERVGHESHWLPAFAFGR